MALLQAGALPRPPLRPHPSFFSPASPPTRRYRARQSPTVQRLVDRLDAVLTIMAYCSGPTCRQPFAVIHPGGGVANLEAAMAPQYDTLYASFAKLSYRACAP